MTTQESIRLPYPFPQTAFDTPRLSLREYRHSDAYALHAIFSDPGVMNYWSTPPHTSTDQTKVWLRRTLDSSNNGTTDFIITLRGTNIAIGKVGLWRLLPDPSTLGSDPNTLCPTLSSPEAGELGFMLGQEYTRYGYMSEALGVLLPYYFERLGLVRVIADVDPRNLPARSLLVKVGFEEKGYRKETFVVGGRLVDSVDYVLERHVWQL
ncbi:acyl-CoA N-acyltransferase, partial [Trichodelitschia bisporula]